MRLFWMESDPEKRRMKMSEAVYTWNGSVWKITNDSSEIKLEKFGEARADFPYCVAKMLLEGLFMPGHKVHRTGEFNNEGE